MSTDPLFIRWLGAIADKVIVQPLTKEIQKMATAQEVHDLVNAGVQAVKDHLDQTAARVLAKVGALNTSITDLKTQLANAGAPADFADVEAKLADLQTEADNIAPGESQTPPAPPTVNP